VTKKQFYDIDTLQQSSGSTQRTEKFLDFVKIWKKKIQKSKPLEMEFLPKV